MKRKACIKSYLVRHLTAVGVILFYALLMLPNRGLALTVDDLYEAEIYVLNQSDAARQTGAKAGLLQVLVRVSGRNDVGSNQRVIEALKNPVPYFNQYSYQAYDPATDPLLPEHNQSGNAKLRLKLNFEPSAIARLLRQAGYPVWGSNRPGVLLWLAVQGENKRYLMAENDTSEISAAVRKLAKQRGLPLLYPLLDIEDKALLSTAEVWGAFNERIDRASLRYNPDSVLTARIQRFETGEWHAYWSYRIEGQWQAFANVAFTATDLVAGIADVLTNALAARYAIDSSRSSVELRVENIASLGDYAALMKYLRSLNPVLDIGVTELDGNQIVLQLSTEGRTSQLIELIQLDEKMVLLSTGDDSSKIHYRWLLQQGDAGEQGY
ncbi:MAG: DUF2066 domain-containing protein [Pseudomonadales bacterium]|nr:DUF2066 domain-containing protein [Pseudomonadales bacterium]